MTMGKKNKQKKNKQKTGQFWRSG